MSLCQQCGQEYCDIGFCFQVNNPEDNVDCVTQWGTTFGAAGKLSQLSSSNTPALWTTVCKRTREQMAGLVTRSASRIELATVETVLSWKVYVQAGALHRHHEEELREI